VIRDKNPIQRRFGVAQMFALALAVLVGSAACNIIKVSQDSDQSQGISGPTTPTASPSPGGACAVKAADLGSEGDVFTAAAGGRVGLVLTVYGEQGLELTDNCRTGLAPTYSVTSLPLANQCYIEGSSWSASIRVASTAAAGTSCTAKARVGGVESDTLTITVNGSSGANGLTDVPGPPLSTDAGVIDR
jgi:hypothetical protein